LYEPGVPKVLAPPDPVVGLALLLLPVVELPPQAEIRTLIAIATAMTSGAIRHCFNIGFPTFLKKLRTIT
jgi:hypothetical protein